MQEESLLVGYGSGVLTLTLNRPERLNALDRPLMRKLAERLQEAAEDARVGCVVLRGAGKGFCAGGDISAAGGRAQPATETAEPSLKPLDSYERYVDWLRGAEESARLLHQMPKPTIASVHGAAAGAGLCLAAACDFRVVADSARFSTAFIRVGFSGDFGGTYFLTQLLGPMKARELYLLGDKISAVEAERIGLVTRLVAEAQLEAETSVLAQRLANGPRVAQRYMKKTLNAAITGELEDILDMEAAQMARCRDTDDHKEAARAFFEKREPQFKGT